MTAAALVALRDVHTHFDDVRAVDGVDLVIPRGEILGLVGESGSGKTTLGRTILRLVPVTSGEVAFDGQDVTRLGGADLRRLRRRMQMIFQDPYSSLSPRLRVSYLLTEPYRINKIPHADQISVHELLEMVELSPELAGKYPHELSGGQARRVGIARALALQPEFLIADEPTAGLDVSAAAAVLNLMQDLARRLGLTYLVITHNLNVVGVHRRPHRRDVPRPARRDRARPSGSSTTPPTPTHARCSRPSPSPIHAAAGSTVASCLRARSRVRATRRRAADSIRAAATLNRARARRFPSSRRSSPVISLRATSGVRYGPTRGRARARPPGGRTMGELDGKTALITGAARGFGRAVAHLFAREGADVAIADIAGELASERVSGMATADDLERTRAEIEALGRRSVAIRADVTKAADCERMAAEALNAFGRIDILHANAGVFSYGKSWELTEDDWDTVLGRELQGHVADDQVRGPAHDRAPLRQDRHDLVARRAARRAELRPLQRVEGGRDRVREVARHRARAVHDQRQRRLSRADGRSQPARTTRAASRATRTGTWSRARRARPTRSSTSSPGARTCSRRAARSTSSEVAEGVLWLASDRAHMVTGHALPVDRGWIAKRGG